MYFKLFHFYYDHPEGIEVYLSIFSRYVFQFPIIFRKGEVINHKKYWILEICIPFFCVIEVSRFQASIKAGKYES